LLQRKLLIKLPAIPKLLLQHSQDFSLRYLLKEIIKQKTFSAYFN
jgi:hypothetical protein